MKILQSNAGVLTNFEVLDFLKSKGASKDLTRVLANVSPSEYKVYDYLVETPAHTQTSESINEFSDKCKKYDLAKAEVVNIINIRPSSMVEIYPIIEECDLRLGDTAEELVEMLVEVFPHPQAAPSPEPEPEPEAAIDESDAKTTNVKQIEEQNDGNKENPKNGEQMEEQNDGDKKNPENGEQMETS